MFGGVGKSAGWATILGTVGFVLSGSVSAKAADLGGDCCADLEERVAELEATTARKGNRKVSLTVSGWVNEQVLYWNDGTENNVYVSNNDMERSSASSTSARALGTSRARPTANSRWAVRARRHTTCSMTRTSPTRGCSPTQSRSQRSASMASSCA
jgi:hypothetical protein